MDFHSIPVLAISFNEDLLFFLVFGVFALIKFLGSRKKGEEEVPPPETDSEQARRTREIQEEIRRRIIESRQNAPRPAPEAAAPVRPVVQPSVMHQEQVVKPSKQRVSAEELLAATRNADLAMQLQKAQKLEAETRKKVALARAGILARSKSVRQTPVSRSGIENMLHNPASLRDAVILSEILAAPVSERRGPSCPGLQ